MPLLLLVSMVAFGQKRKAPVRYKSITDSEFAIGDRIDLGAVDVIRLPLGKDSLAIPDSLDLYRHFVQQNPLMTFKLHMIWKNQGVKYPGRTDRTRDVLLEYLNEDGPDEDSTCYITGFKHTFTKQEPILRVELEVIGVRAPNLDRSSLNGAIGLPEINILYRDYNNIVEFAASGLYDQCFLEGRGVALSLSEVEGQFIARVTGGSRIATMTIKTVRGADTIALGTYTYRVSELPLPALYLGTVELETIGSISEENFLSFSRLFAKYPPEVPLKAAFEVAEIHFSIAGKTYVSQGKLFSEEVKQAYEQAETGAEFVIESVTINGPSGKHAIAGPFHRIKQSAKGAKYRDTPLQKTVFSNCEG